MLQIAEVLASGAQNMATINGATKPLAVSRGAVLRCHPAASICLLEW
ncbi:hypothetical protein N5853_09080 [Bartonella sp. HY329]|nr:MULTISPECIES: hypothetical protein [unclassified Bartonella]UXM94259.1 hypothetical protein N5853_09080 [Bartonella sp. HY329]UXN08582.1 hypothetical protein N5852_09090 [Bartonella sp. HY328]